LKSAFFDTVFDIKKIKGHIDTFFKL